MNVEFRRVKEIFLAAVERPDAAERDAYLREARGPDERCAANMGTGIAPCPRLQSGGFRARKSVPARL